MALTIHSAFSVEKVWIDCLIVGIFSLLHLVANWQSPGLPQKEPDDRDQAFSYVKELASTSVTVVGILLPLSLTAVGTFAANDKARSAALVNIFIGDAWLTLSLTLGLVVLWAAGFQAHTRNVQNLRLVRLLNGWQLIALLAGVIRLLIASFELVQNASG